MEEIESKSSSPNLDFLDDNKKGKFSFNEAISMNNISKWFSQKENQYFIGILIFAIILRLNYFLLTKNQPLWWDEASFGSLAKNYISHIWDGTRMIIGETHIRPPLFTLLWSILLKIGFNEATIRFILELIPSILSVLLVYLIGKELYNYKIGLISSFIFSTLWIHLFYTARLMTDIPALLFFLISLYFLILSMKSEKTLNYNYLSLSIIFITLSTLTRYSYGLYFLVYFIIILLYKKLYLNDKKFWIYGIIGLIPLLIFFTYNYFTFGNIYPALLGGDYLTPAETATGQAAPFAWHFLNFIPIYLSTYSPFQNFPNTIQSVISLSFTLMFLIGLGIVIFELLIGYNLITKNKKLKSHILLLLVLIGIYSFFIFYLKGAEDRYFMPSALTLCIFSAISILFIYNYFKTHNKVFAIIIISLILLSGTYAELKHADFIIKSKKDSYLQEKQGFEWIKYNTPQDSVIAGTGFEPYAVYYANRKILTIPPNESNADEISKADYVVLHAFSPQESYINAYLQNNNWVGYKAFFFDAEEKNPAFVIFKKNQ